MPQEKWLASSGPSGHNPPVPGAEHKAGRGGDPTRLEASGAVVIIQKKDASRQKGRVRWFDDQRGYGFAVIEGHEEDIFVHHSNITTDGYPTLKKGQLIEFEVEDGKRGKVARNIKVVKE